MDTRSISVGEKGGLDVRKCCCDFWEKHRSKMRGGQKSQDPV